MELGVGPSPTAVSLPGCSPCEDASGARCRWPLTASRPWPAYHLQLDRYELHTLQLFTVREGTIVRTTVYQDPQVFAIFELPKVLL